MKFESLPVFYPRRYILLSQQVFSAERTSTRFRAIACVMKNEYLYFND
jgi:hypothetical protein